MEYKNESNVSVMTTDVIRLSLSVKGKIYQSGFF